MDRIPNLRRTLPSAMVDRLALALRQMVAVCGPQTLVLTESTLPADNAANEGRNRFIAVVSSQFSGVLLAEPLPESESIQTGVVMVPTLHQVELLLDPSAIAAFLTTLEAAFQSQPKALKTLAQARANLRPNDPTLQSEFTLQLVEILTADQPSTHHSACDLMVEAALRQQVEQERLLNQVTTQIRQSLDLTAILQTSVQQACKLLAADRVLIYEFAHPSATGPVKRGTENKAPASLDLGRITYEALASDTIPSVLNLTEQDECFTSAIHSHEKYQKGFILAVDDVEATYAFSPCLLKLMQHVRAKAKLVAPIVVQEQLWGLLVAHQCLELRHWQDYEKTFLQRIAEHLAIAIYQSQLYAQLQQQKQMLEKRVVERTQELGDALVAAQAASRAKSEFLAAMSHELRTPLTCVIGMAETLLRAMSQKTGTYSLQPQKQQEYLNIIKRSGEHLLELINDILDLSQVEAGKTVLNINQFSLSNLTNQSLQMFREKARTAGIELVMDLRVPPNGGKGANAIGDIFVADRRRIRQILLNLLSNAVKFTPAGGRVTLRVWTEANMAVFQVEDTGIGIPRDQQHLLFQKFQQLDAAYHRRYEGTGLGLALTKQLVELHGGKIEVESTVGSGSTFTVRLPSQLADRSNGFNLRDLPPSLAGFANGDRENGTDTHVSLAFGGRIVLIEDHEETAMLVCDLLTAAGCQVVWLLDGHTAIKQIELLQPALVITDIQLPGMDGFEIIQFLRHHAVMSSIKILVLTARALPEDKQRCLDEGADDYLAKPVQPYQLLDKVSALVNGKEGSGGEGGRGRA